MSEAAASVVEDFRDAAPSAAAPPGRDDLSIVVFAPTSNDAKLTADFLRKARLSAAVCASAAEVEAHVESGCGALLLAEEVLEAATVHALAGQLGAQPSWSDLPLIIITSTGAAPRVRPRYLKTLGPVGNIAIIERPVRPETLVSTCEVALRSRRRQYQVRDLVEEREAAMASISDAFMTLDRNWCYTFLNEKAETLAGRPRAELLGECIWDSFPGARQSDVHARMLRTMVEQKNLEFEYFHPALRRWLEVRVYPSPQGVSIFTTDITSRREAEEQLRESQARLNFALASAQVGDFDLNLLDDTSRRSLRHDQVFGYREPVEKWGFQTMLQHIHQDDRDEVARKYLSAVSGERDWHFEARVVWPDLSVHWISLHGSLYRDTRDRPTRMLGIVMDITARKDAEQALIQQARALRTADQRKDEFLAMLAHELRNPLAAVANAATILKTDDGGEHAWAAGVIARQSGQLSRLIDDLLDVSRITTGKVRLRREVLDVAAVLDRARDSAKSLVEERQHTLACEYPRGQLWIEADATRMEQIVLNLLTNAAKYTPAGGRIALTATVEGATVMIRVEDNGVGIVPERLPEMFQLFAQGERSIARSEGGLGIGLTIVQKLVEMHGGRIDAHSGGPNQGSAFTVCLPLTRRGAARGEKPETTAARETRGRRVLIVDDNVDTAQGLSRLLARAGHFPQMAHDGLQALERARELQPEAVVLDIGLPGMDGLEVVQRLRQEEACARATIIAVTGYGQPADRQRALDAGFDHHMVKPVDLEKLMALLNAE